MKAILNTCPSPRPTVLGVDGAPSNVRAIAQELRHYYDVLVATSGENALALLQKSRKPDLILLDIVMPGMDGYEVCRRIKKDRTIAEIPVIFISAKDSVDDQQFGFSLGAVDYVTKPLEMPLVLMRIAVHIRLKRKSERLEQLALIDSLTDIANRRALDELFHKECRRAAREKISLAIIMIDIDHFKEFNDHYGHSAGDDCIRSVAQTLDTSLRRPGDVVARYGGEEFCVLLPDCTAKGAFLVAENLRESILALELPHESSETAQYVTISLGMSARPILVNDISHRHILHEADQALYAAKARGRNRVVVSGSSI